MKQIILFLALIIHSLPVFCQNASCKVEKKEGFVIKIEGDNNGTINQARILNIRNFNCNGCNISFSFYQDGSLSLFGSKSGTNKNTTNPKENDKPKLELVELKRKSIALNILSGLPTDKQQCINDIVVSQINQDHYQVFQSEDKNNTLIEIPMDEDELVRLGLKIVYPEKEGVTRIQEFGKYYFLRTDGSCLSVKNETCERYSTATDFLNGSAIIGIESPKLQHYFLNLKGEQSSFSFDSFEESFGKNNDIIKIKGYSQYALASRSMKLLTDWFSEITESNGLIQVKKDGKFGLFRQEGTEFYELIPPNYEQLNFLDYSLLVVKKEDKYYLLDRKKNFANLLISDYPITQATKNEYGIVFETNNKKGIFLVKDRVIISPKYDDIPILGKEYAKCRLDAKYTYLNFSMNKEIGLFESMSDSPDRNGFIKVQQNGKWGYVGFSGNEIIEPIYITALDFDKKYNLAWASVADDSSGLLDQWGKFTVFPKLIFMLHNECITPFNKYGLSFTSYFRSSTSNKYNGVVSYKKKVLVQDNIRKFSVIDTENPEIGFVTDSSQVHFFVKDGERITNIYSYVGSPNAIGTRIVGITGEYNGPIYYGLLGKDLKEILPCKSRVIRELKNNRYAVKLLRDEVYGMYDDRGKEKGRSYSKIRPFVGNYAVTECIEAGGICVIDTSGKEITHCMAYSEMSDVILGKYSIATQDNQKGIVDISIESKVLPTVCDDITYRNDVFICKKGNKSFQLQKLTPSPLLKCINGDCDVYDSLLKSAK